MGFVAFYFEIKATKGQDYFSDPPEDASPGTIAEWRFIKDNFEGEHLYNLGQTVSYAVEMCKRQHRYCCYSVSISGPLARFIRWDRAGAIVSRAFNYRERPDILCEFLWCFSQVSDVVRGYDLTVEPATPEQEVSFRNAIEAHLRTQLHSDASVMEHIAALKEHYQPNAVTAVYLPCDPNFSDEESRYLLVSRPIAVPLSVAGRCSRTYWAYDPALSKVVFLKDTWRYGDPVLPGSTETAAADDLEREGNVLIQLVAKGVRNIPNVIHHEDVPETKLVDGYPCESIDTIAYHGE